MIDTVELIRLEKGSEGTFGVLRLNGQVFCVTLEPPDNGNVRDVSCIPAGRYACRRVESPRFGATYEVCDVPERSHILFHKGNVTGDTHGCVLLGSRFGQLRGDRAILDSGRTVDRFMAQCGDCGGFNFVVRESCGEGEWTISA
ncbi:DUF5675 family protein [uncultured Pseudodesulfovibrio sp.]|uniref:DUF5675 family protein n=1 Tax=uncultured Pseudodesulfovibrio sp. TaxID=2035858 RepID=UPI0029C98210|nr:DUF5675 family protein [uncultured Pseudodesulfovibrio sp.]